MSELFGFLSPDQEKDLSDLSLIAKTAIAAIGVVTAVFVAAKAGLDVAEKSRNLYNKSCSNGQHR